MIIDYRASKKAIIKQEDNYEQRLFNLKCNQQCTPDVFRDGNKSRKVWLLIELSIKNSKARGKVLLIFL